MTRIYKFPTITTVGADGSAAGTATTEYPIAGEIKSVHIDYANQPATTDVTIATTHAPVLTILTVADNNTDGWYHPRHLIQDAAGADVTGLYDCVYVNDYVKVTVAQADGAGGDETVTVTLVYED